MYSQLGCHLWEIAQLAALTILDIDLGCFLLQFLSFRPDIQLFDSFTSTAARRTTFFRIVARTKMQYAV